MRGTERLARIVYLGLLAGSALWLGLILLAPALMAWRRVAASAVIYGAFSAVCHQIPERSFHLRGYPLAVCSRCTAIYAGFLLGLLAYPLRGAIDGGEFPPRRWLILAGIPMLLDFMAGFAGVAENTFLSRSLTGALFGAAAAFYLMPGLFSAVRDLAVK